MRRPILTAAAPACILLGLTPVAAAADVAPPGAAHATAARVSDLVSVSDSQASAGDANSNAQAAVISLNKKPVLGTGAAQDSEGQHEGNAVDTGASDLPVRVQVAPWKAQAKGKKGSAGRSSHASAALAEVDVKDTAKAGVLTSDATAEHTDTKSTGKSVSNAADVSVGDLRLVLLHSEVDETAKGHSYLLGLNGTEIGTDQQFKNCALDASGVLSLSCLTVSGGVANGVTSGGAQVAGVNTALGLNPVTAFTTAGSSATGTPSILESVAAALPAETPRAVAAAPVTNPAVSLPRTGGQVASLAASAFGALLMGLGLRKLSRRRATVR
jgi:hypothetical protein